MVDVTLPMAEADRVEALPRFAAGTSISRFRIVGELGAGGMGIVFEAYDPELDRQVAIKVLGDRDAGRKLLDEAQAMARLAHPNVVPVYEVGTIDDQLFLVMELVRGETLASWLDRPHGWREIVRAFLEAGAGLAAAHAADLVHRDFKPSNALVDRTGRVRVSDLGLARAPSSGPVRAAGTTGYMAPEQIEGRAVDARSDEYAFAVSLDRALSGKRVPRAIRAAIARAMASEPDARFPTMDALLAALQRGLSARRRYVAIGAVTVIGVAAASALVVWKLAAQGDGCASGAALIDSVWNRARGDELVRQLAAARPSAAPGVATGRRMLDGWADGWRLGRREACHADERSARIGCLDGELGELRAQLAAWAHPDATAADRIVTAVGGLPDPDRCSHPSPQLSLRARPIVERAAALDAAHRAGTSRAVAAAGPALVADARQLGEPGALAVALLAAGEIARDLGDDQKAHDEFAEAVVQAGKAGDDARLLDALQSEAVLATSIGRPMDGLGLLDAADAIVARTGAADDGRNATIRGNAFLDAGKLGDAERELQKAVTVLESLAQRDPARDLQLANALNLLGTAYYQGSEVGKARPLLLRALAIRENELGPMHPEVGAAVGDLGELESKAGMLDDADAHTERARAIFAMAYGPDDQHVAQALMQRAFIAARRGKLAEGARMTEEARAVFAKSLQPDDLTFVSLETQLGAMVGCEKGIPHFQSALAILERRGQAAETHGVIEGQLAMCLDDVGRDDDAYAAAAKAVAELENAKAAPAQCAMSWMLLADFEAKRGHALRAIQLAQHLLDATREGETPQLDTMRAHEQTQLAAWRR